MSLFGFLNVSLVAFLNLQCMKWVHTRVVVKYNWSSTQILQVLWIKYKYKYFAFSAIKYSSTSSTDMSSTSTSTYLNYFPLRSRYSKSTPRRHRNGIYILGIQYQLHLLGESFNITVEPLLYDHPQNHIGVVV